MTSSDSRGHTLAACALAFGAAACSNDARFATKFASDYAPAAHTVSVLGVYKDGRMSAAGWSALAPYVLPALGPRSETSHCDVGYDLLTSTDRGLAEAVDRCAQDDGPTDELLSDLAPAAQGDLVLVFTFAGRLPQHTPDPSAGSSAQTPGRRGPTGPTRGYTPTVIDPNELDVSASLFSVAERRSVAMLAMRYAGSSAEDALTQFGAKLGQSFPALTCAGWNWSAKVGSDRIRRAAKD